VKIYFLLLSLILTSCRSSYSQPVGTPQNLNIETVAARLDTLWAIDFAPDGRVFITERPGRIRIIERGQLRAEP
jgi:glucose/arabinose dehydrogenase